MCKEGIHAEIDLDEVRDHAKSVDSSLKFPRKVSYVASFLREYVEDGHRLGEMVSTRKHNSRVHTIVVDEHWLTQHAIIAKDLNLKPVDAIYQESKTALPPEVEDEDEDDYDDL